MKFDVAVVGGGAVGTASTYAMARVGLKVALIERDSHVGRGASRGTACLATASHAERLANREALREAIHFLTDPAGPLAIRPSPKLAFWLARFVTNALREREARVGTTLLQSLCTRSIDLHRQWSRSFETGLIERGVLNIWTTPAGIAHRDRIAGEHRRVGLEFQLLSRSELHELEPGLVGGLGGTLYPGEAHLDSEQFCVRAAEAAIRHGASLLADTEVLSIRPSAEVVEIQTTRGQVCAGTVVLAAGIDSRDFARELGARMPMRPAKGYNVEFAGLDEVLTRPVFIAEARVVATPLAGRLRLAGTLEFGTPESAVSQTRLQSIIGAGAANISGVLCARPTGIWRGPRPVTTDGLPIIGRSHKHPRVVIATGHAMLGVTLAPLTAEWVRMLVTGEQVPSEVKAFDPGRFRL